MVGVNVGRDRWYLSLAFADYMQSPGEAVWLRNQVRSCGWGTFDMLSMLMRERDGVRQFRALHELGYTILATNSYEGMVQAHREMPDVM